MKETPYELFEQYLQNTLDTEAERAFYEWVNASNENKQLFFEFKFWKEAGNESKEIDIEASWQRLLAKQDPAPARTGSFLNYSFLKYAAAVALVIVGTLLYLLIFSNKDNTPATLYITGNTTKADQLVLPDGTNVMLGPNSTFSLAPAFNDKQRVVYLKGEALFNVSQNKEKAFIVKTALQDIQVLGTKFNVQAYPNDLYYTTTLLEGAVSMTTKGLREKAILKPNQQLIYNRKNNSQKVQVVDANRYASWVEGYYYFADQTLNEILSRLSHIYGFSFQIENPALATKKFTGTFRKEQSIDDILAIIKISIPITYTFTNNNIIIK